MSTGALVAVQGYNQLSDIGVEALTGFVSAYLNVRLVAPLTAGIGLAATIGAGATAQLGAMRINEEIDALEVMGVRSIAYLASTRVVAGVIVVIPLYCVAVADVVFGRPVRHHLRLRPVHRRLRPLLQYVPEPHRPDVVVRPSVAMARRSIMLVHTYYGFTASGGPAGVGEAVGRAVRDLVGRGGRSSSCSCRWPSTASPATSTCPDSAMDTEQSRRRARTRPGGPRSWSSSSRR